MTHASDQSATERDKIAERLNRLFEVVYPAGREPWTNDEVSHATGVPVRRIAQLRAGLSDDRVENSQENIFSSRLNFLFHTRPSPQTGKRRTNNDVSRATGISRSYMGYLLKGSRQPTLNVCEALARYFRVPVTFFTDGDLAALARHFGVDPAFFSDDEMAGDIMENLENLDRMREERLTQIMGRGGAPQSLHPSEVETMLARVRKDSRLRRILGHLIRMSPSDIAAIERVTERFHEEAHRGTPGQRLES